MHRIHKPNFPIRKAQNSLAARETIDLSRPDEKLHFSSMSLTTALNISAAINALEGSADSIKAAVLQGGWRARRFVVTSITRSHCPVDEPLFDFEDHALTVALEVAPDLLVAACRKFGVTVERHFRADQHPVEPQLSLDDGMVHLLRPYTHAALCAHEGPWLQDEHTVLNRFRTCCSCRAREWTSPGTPILPGLLWQRSYRPSRSQS